MNWRATRTKSWSGATKCNKLLVDRAHVNHLRRELDLDNVIQTPTIFLNVSKGQAAPKEDLEKCFNGATQDKIVLEILAKGELQISTLERNSQLQNIQKDIVQIITEKTINPTTNRPYPATMLEKIVAELGYSVTATKSPKLQALEIIKQLQRDNVIPIARAHMRVQIILPAKDAKRIKEKLQTCLHSIESEVFGTVECQMVIRQVFRSN